MKRLFVSFYLAVLALLLTACGGPAAQPLAFNPAPWQDGEISVYRVADANGTELGTAQWAWQRTTDGWSQTYEVRLGSRLDRGEVLLTDDLAMRAAWREVGGNRYEARYAADGITIATTTGGATTSKTLKAVADAVDNDVSLQIQRALPLAAGYATGYTDVIPTTGRSVPVKLTVTAAETITVPAGPFLTWRVELSFGSGKHDAWYGQAEPYPLVKYRNRASGAVFELLSTEAGASAPAPVGRGEVPSPEVASPAALPPVNAPLLLVTFLAQMPLMLLFPLLLGWWIRRRFGIGWGVFGIGALTFIASQVVHLPLNYALGLLGGGRGVALWPLIPLALVAGLSAGAALAALLLRDPRGPDAWGDLMNAAVLQAILLIAVRIVLRTLARRTRGWRAGLQFGAGHGAAEAIIFGALVLVNVIAMIALRSLDPAVLGLAGAAAEQIQAAQATYWNTAAYLPILAGLERVMAITLHIALATLGMRSVARRRPLYLLAAIGLHTAVNAWAVWAVQTAGIWATYAGLLAFAVLSLWLIWRLREAPPPVELAPAPAPIPTAADLAPRALSPEELARRAAASQYE